ncbi:hypothetical protein MPER_05320, partial [Moniliophthora perniciosa FA553]
SLIVLQPTIHVGIVSEGIASEVWIAPQVSAKRKANARGEAHVEAQPPRLVPNAKTRSFIWGIPSWKAVWGEESRAEQRAQASTQAANEAEEEEQMPAIKVDYLPIDSRHLSSLPLVRAGVIKLLKASNSNIHAAGNMIVTLVLRQLLFKLFSYRALPTDQK